MKKTDKPVEGRFEHLIYAPAGEIEGVLISVNGTPTQIVVDKHDVGATGVLHALRPGQTVAFEVEPAAANKKGEPVHAVFEYRSLATVDGKSPAAAAACEEGYRGKVVRLNFAKHGEPNGYVLDTGDFIHVRPSGFRRLSLGIGDSIVATGDAHRTADDRGWAVEADVVNDVQLS